MKTWIIGCVALVLGLGTVITADQMGLLRPAPVAVPAQDRAGVPDDPVAADPDPVVQVSATAGEPGEPGALAPAEAGERLLRAPSQTCDQAATPITLGHPGVVDQAGLAFATAVPATAAAHITATGRIAFPTDRHARLSGRAAGIVAGVAVDLGDRVEAGSALLRIDSAELGSAVASLRHARADLERWQRSVERQRRLAAEGIGSDAELTAAEASLLQARAGLAGARQALGNLGLVPEEIAAIGADAEGQDSGTLQLRAPFAGTVISLSAAPGEHRERGEHLVTIADTSRVWAMLDVPERDLPHVHAGLQVPVRPDAGPGGEPVAGSVTWIAPTVDERTRTVPVRVELDNADGRFRAGQFVVADIPRHTAGDLVLVPRTAVQWDGCCNVVFVPGASDREFRTRQIQVAHRAGDLVAIADGIRPGQPVVTEGSWLLKTEILKGAIGAGCCEVH